jgi:mRNA interferase MazF
VNLDPTVGSEIQKSRPCVVVSPAELNDTLRTVIVAPMTSKGFAAPFRVPVTHAGTKGQIVLDQLRTVDKLRLAKKLGAVSAKTLSTVLVTLQEVFAE